MQLYSSLLACAIVGSAIARPDAALSSSYGAPSSSYGAPSGFGGSSGGFGSSGGSLGGHGGGFSRGSSGGSLVGNSFGSSLSSGLLGGGFSSGGLSGLSSGGFSSGGSSDGGYSYNQAPIVQKHIYVHVPPADPVEYAPQHHYPQQVPQKHYKIVFIKAPTPPTPTAPVLPQLQQDSEKTLIYVLVKKPEDPPRIEIPTLAPTTPSKPEVYFIRYKTQKDKGGYGSGSLGGNIPSLTGNSLDGNDDPSSFGGHSSGPSSSYGSPSQGGSY